MPFTDEQPFLDAIFARYHDDGPRLVYADFLEACGDTERAELVRVQLALGRLRDEHPRRPELAEREAELLNANRERWTEHLRDLVAGVEFRRGVLDSVAVDAETFLTHGEELFRRVPVRRLRLQDASHAIPKLIECPLLAEVRELDLCAGELGNGGVNLLCRSPFLMRTESLHLGFNGLDDAGVEALARCSGFPKLAALSLNDNGPITGEGLARLAHSPFFCGLTTLDVSGNEITDAGVCAVVASKTLTRLHTFRLTSNPVGDVGIAALAGSALLGRQLALSPHLDLRKTGLGPVGVEKLVANAALVNCVTLDLSENALGDLGFGTLLGSPYTKNLRVLKVARNQITDIGIWALRHLVPHFFTQLHFLDLSENRLTRYGMGLLQAARGEHRVTLELGGNVQAATAGVAPVPVGDVVPDLLNDVAQAAELRRRVAHPTRRPGDRPNAH